jgi:hypothetical protein
MIIQVLSAFGLAATPPNHTVAVKFFPRIVFISVALLADTIPVNLSVAFAPSATPLENPAFDKCITMVFDDTG